MTVIALALAITALLGWTLHARHLRDRIRQLETDRDRFSAELDAAHLLGAALADRYWRAERRAGRQFVRSFKRRAALVRIARYCRQLRDDLDVADIVGAELAAGMHDQAARYDAAIEALTRRIAELMPGRETSASISAWQNETFGPATTTLERLKRSADKMVAAMFRASHRIKPNSPTPNLSRAIRAAEELAELIELLVTDDNATKAPEEVADIDIVLRGIDAAHGVERAATVDAKMAKNRARVWKLTGDGHGQHVEPPSDRIPPTSANCKLLGAERCEHEPMTAEGTQAVFGKELQR